MALQILNDIQGIGLKDLFDTYAFINQQNINKGVTKSQSLIAELNAQADLARAQALAKVNVFSEAVTGNNWVKYGLIAAVVLAAGFVLIKK